jgi:crotonobetainyl-CoA:carnitine CoA-transferase CaiB-like acyl-CoA transferase
VQNAPVKPLEGIRVLDISRIVSGPVCCWFLASLGAEVIRVEAPGGDQSWRAPPYFGPEGYHRGNRGPRDIGLSSLRKHRNKRSVVLDLKNPAGLEAFKALVQRCDVLVENFAPGATGRIGIDYETLSALNQRLVYCSITGYGDSGPYRDRSAMDLVVQAVSGLMSKTGFPDGPPTKVGATVGDQVPALFGALGILAALRQRDHDGKGQHVDIAMLDSLVTLLWDEPLDDYEDHGVPERVGNGDPRGAPLEVFRSTDGWVAMVMTNDDQWAQLCNLMERPELVERYARMRDRSAERDEVNGIVGEWIRTRSTDAVMDALISISVPAGPVQSAWSARHDPQVAHRGALERLRHPDLEAPSDLLGPVLPVRLSRAELTQTPAEVLGSSTESVLRELLDADDAEIERLRTQGALGPVGES